MVLLRAFGLDVYDNFNEFLQEEGVTEQIAGQKTLFTTGGRFGGGYFRIDNDDSGIDITIPASTTIFFGVSVRINVNWDGPADNIFLFRSASGIHAQIQTITGGSNVNVIGGGVARGEFKITNNIWHRLEVKVKVDDTTGNVTVRLDGVEVVTFEGDVQTGADNFISIVELDGVTTSPLISSDDITINDDQGGVNDDFLGDLRIDTLRPTAETGRQDFTPSSGSDNALMVDDSPGADDDATYISNDTITEQDLYVTSDSEGLAPLTIHGVVIRGKVKKDDAGDRSVKFLANTGTIGVSSAFLLSTSYQYAEGIFDTDPSTSGAPFTKANVDAIQIGVEVA